MRDNFEFGLIDLFCGAGGLSEGFKQVGFTPLLGVDLDKYAIDTYNRNHDECGIVTDIKDLTVNQIKKKTNNKKIHVIAAGPPCQAFSTVAIAKLRSLKKPITVRNPLNQLYKEVLRITKGVKPEFLIMENVGRMFSIDDGMIKKEIERELQGEYTVSFSYENVAEYGIPQIRKRGLLIANRLNVENPVLEKTHYDPKRTKISDLKPFLTLKEIISDLPQISSGSGLEFTEYPKASSVSRYARERRSRSKGVFNHTSRKHSERDLRIFKKLKPGQNLGDLPKKNNPYRSDIFKDKIRKQRWDRPSPTILAHLSKDGLMFVHPDSRQNRSFTPRESARIQSFDDKFVFDGPRTQQFLQIGNAVPPLFSKIVAESIRPLLN